MSNNADNLRGGFERSDAGPRLIAATREIAETEIRRAHAHTTMPGVKLDVDFDIDDRRYAPGDITAAIGHFVLNPGLPDITLASFYLAGGWDAALAAEQEIRDGSAVLEDRGYRLKFFSHGEKKSKIVNIALRIVAAQTREAGFVAEYRTRLFGRAVSQLWGTDFEDPRAVLNFRKSSWCTIDIEGLAAESPIAADEVNTIIAASQLRAIRLDFVALEAAHEAGALRPEWLGRFFAADASENDHARVERVQEKIETSGVDPNHVFNRLLRIPQMEHVLIPMTFDVLEWGIGTQQPFVTPAANTYHLAESTRVTKHVPFRDWLPGAS